MNSNIRHNSPAAACQVSWLKLLPTAALSAALVSPFLAVGAEPAAAGVNFVKTPEGARSISITLNAVETGGARPQGYLAQRSPEPATETASLPPAIAESYTGKEFVAYDIARLPDGTRYLVVFNEDKSVRFLSRNEANMWYARVYRVGPGSDAKPEIVREGFQSSGNDVLVPVEIELPGIGATKLQKVRTEIGYSFSGFNNSKPQIYTGRGAGLQVAGSRVEKEGKLTMTVSVPEDLKITGDTQVTLRFEPITPGLPERTAAAKLTDFLTLGAARFVVTGMAPDFSQASLAIVAGSLEETLKQQLQLGAQMPPFSQVDLVSRKSVTREEVLGKAKGGAPVFFVFGDLPVPRSQFGPSYPIGGGTASLPLPPAEIADQLGLELSPKPVVVFVTRQIGIDFLYGDLRNKTPDYFVLADFADPLRTTFRAPQAGPGYYPAPYPGSREPSLRQLFNLPERTLSIAAFDGSGKVVYVKADAANEFLPAIAEARAACKRKH